jgi:hypothetical protein
VAAHKDELLATRAAARADPPADRGWRRVVALWPDDWRRRWGRLVNEREDGGEPWDVAEWRAFLATVAELVAAEDRGEVAAWSYPGGSAIDDLTDAEAVAMIDRAFAPPPRRRAGGLVWHALTVAAR